jgi:hypothetical protein
MRYLSLFDDFNKVDETYSFDSEGVLEAKINQMSSLKENCMAAWDFSEFKNFFKGSLNENNSEEENEVLLEKAYSTYELGVLYENNQDWFESKEDIFFLSGENIEEGHVVLFKNNRLHIIKESTLERLKEGSELILEGFFGAIGDFVEGAAKGSKEAFNKYVVQPVKKAAIYVGKKAVQAWDNLSAGAKKVWEFSRKILSAIGVFINENPLTAMGIGLQILAGVASFFPAFGTAIAGVLSAIAGAITIIEAVQNIYAATKDIGAADKVKNIIKGGSKLVFGAVELILGIKDVVTGVGDSVPGAAMMGVTLKTGVISWATKFNSKAFSATIAGTGIGKVVGSSEWLGEFFTTLCEKAPFMTKVGKDGTKVGNIVKTTTKLLAKGGNAGVASGREELLDHEEYQEEWNEEINESEGGSWGFSELFINFLVYVGKSCFGWLYDTVIAGIGLVGKAINGLLEIPGKITRGIDNFKKNYSGSFVGGIISSALSSAVRPLTNCAQKFIDVYIKPKVKPVTGWMTSLGKRNDEIWKKVQSNKKLESPVEGIKEQSGLKIPAKKLDITTRDKTSIKKIGNSGISSLVKAGGGSEKILEKIKKANDEFKKKFPAVTKVKGGKFGQSKSGAATFTYKSKAAEGSVTLFNNGKYFVLDGINKNSKGDFKGDNDKIVLTQPEGGFKKAKNESRSYINTFEEFSFGI